MVSRATGKYVVAQRIILEPLRQMCQEVSHVVSVRGITGISVNRGAFFPDTYHNIMF